MSSDPAGTSAGPNLFVYVEDSPIQLLDTTGNDPEHCSFPVNDDFKYKIGAFHCLPTPIHKRKGRGGSSGNRGKAHQHRSDSSSGGKHGKQGGQKGGKEGGKEGGVEGGTGTKTPTTNITEQGAGDGPGGLGEPGDVGTGKLPGIGTEGEGTPTGTTKGKATDKPGDEGGKEGGKQGGSKDATGKKQGDKSEGKPGEQKDALDHLSELASFLDDPESLYNAKESGNKGKGTQMGNKHGILSGPIAQILAVIVVLGTLIWGLFKGFKDLFKKGWKRLFDKTEKKALPAVKKLLPPGSAGHVFDEADKIIIEGQMRLGKTQKQAEEYVLEMRKEFRGTVHVPEGPNSQGTTRIPPWMRKK